MSGPVNLQAHRRRMVAIMAATKTQWLTKSELAAILDCTPITASEWLLSMAELGVLTSRLRKAEGLTGRPPLEFSLASGWRGHDGG